MGSDSQQATRNRPPGIRRFSKESKVPNKRERKSFRVYVEVSRAQHPASKPELEADGFGQSTAISNPMAFRKQATRDTTLFERKQGSKQKRKKELSCLCWSFKSSTPSLQARTRGGWVRVKGDLQTYGLQKNRPPGIRRFSKESKVPNKRERKSFRVYVEVSRAQHPASKPELEADGSESKAIISKPMAFKRDTTLFERKQGSKQKRKKERWCLCWNCKN